eukprot:IDg9341t1
MDLFSNAAFSITEPAHNVDSVLDPELKH